MKISQKEIFPETRSGREQLDEITGGGVPNGRPTLICGSAGCGKTLIAQTLHIQSTILEDNDVVYFILILNNRQSDS